MRHAFSREGRVDCEEVVVVVGDIFVIGRQSRCGMFCADLDTGCRLEWGRIPGAVEIFQQASAEEIVIKSGRSRVKATPMVKALGLDEFDQEEAGVEKPFPSPLEPLMWSANQTLNAAIAVARYSRPPKGML